MKPLLAALNDLPEFRQLCAAVDTGAMQSWATRSPGWMV